MKNNFSPFKNLSSDLPASIVVFLVAMPLCLGIALASGAPLYSGIISGIIGGIVVGAISGSAIGVSGPAAGLAVIVLNAITNLGGFEIMLVATIFAGVIQVIMGYLKAGIIGYYFPSSVIHGMLTGIGILIILKQIPHAFGYDHDPEGDLEFMQYDGENTFSEIFQMVNNISVGPLVVTLISLGILLLWSSSLMNNLKFTKIIPGPLVAVLSGIALSNLFTGTSLHISSDHMVNLPKNDSIAHFMENFTFPDFKNGLTNPKVYSTAIIMAIVASLETLLSLEATDKQDPYKRLSPTNLELKAQGIGNIISGFIGGLPITQVIVRSSANSQSGAKTKMSTIVHGFLLLFSVLFISDFLNQIPLATLASILFVVGYKLAKPSLFVKLYKQGWGQFLPFIVTIIAMIFTDLLMGISMGMVVAIGVILYNNFKVPYTLLKSKDTETTKFKMILSEDVSFINKASIMQTLKEIPDNSHIEIDASKNHFIHFDVIEIIEDFQINAKSRNIDVTVTELYENVKTSTPSHMELISEK